MTIHERVPYPGIDVLVTDGKEVWIGDYSPLRNKRDGYWAVVYDGAPPFDSTEITHWMHFPEPPKQNT